MRILVFVGTILLSSALWADVTTQPTLDKGPPPTPSYMGVLVPLIHRAETIMRAPVAQDWQTQRPKDIDGECKASIGKTVSVSFVVDSINDSGDGEYTVSGHIAWYPETQLSSSEKTAQAKIVADANKKIADDQSSIASIHPIVPSHGKHGAAKADNYSHDEVQRYQDDIKKVDADRKAQLSEIRKTAERRRPNLLVKIISDNPEISTWESGQTHTTKGSISSLEQAYYAACPHEDLALKPHKKSAPIEYYADGVPKKVELSEITNPQDLYVILEGTIEVPTATTQPQQAAVVTPKEN